MAALVSERERVTVETRAPLIELAAVEKVYRRCSRTGSRTPATTWAPRSSTCRKPVSSPPTARSRRRIFATESAAIAVAGRLVGVPVGYLLDRLLVWPMKEVVNIDVPLAFPAGNLALTLVGTVVLALLTTAVPIRRAVHHRPGKALRYA